MRINPAIVILLVINPIYVPLSNRMFVNLIPNPHVVFSGTSHRKWPRNSRRGCGNYMTRKRLRRNRKRMRM